MEEALYTATIFLMTTVIAVPISARLGLGSVLGYLAAGILIGPVLGLVGTHEADELLHYAEFGVVMMLFIIGLELDPRALWAMRDKLVGLGGLQVLLTGLAVFTLAVILNRPINVAIACGMIFALSSTAIVLQTLTEKGLMQTSGGRSTFAVLLTQDIAVIPMLVILPLLAGATLPHVMADGSISVGAHEKAAHGLSLVDGLPGWGMALVTLGAVAAIIVGGRYLTRPVFRFIHAAHLPEMYTALALLIVVGIAFLMHLVGLSPALGTFLAGVLLANSEFRHELESDIAPFKGLLLGLFFITVGAQIDLDIFFAAPGDILGLTLAVMILKAVVLYGIGRAFGLRRRALWLFTLGLAQAGEFGFVLITTALSQNVLPHTLAERLLLIVALSMLITPLLFILYDQISKRFGEKEEERREPDTIDRTGPVIIAGIGRFGQIVNRLVRASGFDTVVLDHNIQAIETMRHFGVKGFFGDPTRPEMLHAAGLSNASVLVVAVDDPAAAIKLTKFARRERPDLHIIARANNRGTVYQLYNAGANDIVREMFDSSLRAGRYVLENIGLSEYEAAQAEQAFYKHDRYAVQELAEVWKEGVPSTQNAEYIKRAKELESELEATLLAQLQEKPREEA
ncbi:cation:proton antiporter domain-containing protein [Shimia sp. MMG029]|uniref:cation:proton antiporter domain-containing protein n=1 Tax=Shimia sp. MMG029 TaxID=3021978 RepID=UPI0022FF15BC|nr:cation:proton antiporter [Shimia sp. MMG029]MDA5556209.1 cation:proton antiporter [Shimia sp. MMG029]